MRLLAISGSLRAGSTNSALLHAAAGLAPGGTDISVYAGLGKLPIYDADLDIDPPPPAVGDLRARLAASWGVLIACPEYAHGVPGGLKNALDWVVSSSEMVDKPVALFHASPRSEISRAALAEILRTIDARIVAEASCTVALLGKEGAALEAELARPEVRETISAALRTFVAAIAVPATASPV
ncbi:MAG: hypothetical protein GC202_00220 [Alphaproteobacteria bacterium]|nr:hypothetical protein [Alphaproteobacteria bacterium]